MMRKVFGGTLLLSIAAAALLGGAFAWNNSKTTSENTLQIGQVSWHMAYEQEPGIYLGPNDGIQRVIGDGGIHNLKNSDFALQITGGNVTIDHVLPTVCAAPAYFSASVSPDNPSGLVNPGDTALSDDDLSVKGSLTAAQFHVLMGVNTVTPDTCAGAEVAYVVTVNVTTAPAT